MEKDNEEIKSHPHFAKAIDCTKEEPWRTDFIFGQTGVNPHGHLAASGAIIWYLRDEQGKEIIKNGEVIKN
jgi:hypothetical protein